MTDRDDWLDRAVRVIEQYMTTISSTGFTSYAVRAWAYSKGTIELAPNERMWGAAIQRLAKAGKVKKVGTTRVPAIDGQGSMLVVQWSRA